MQQFYEINNITTIITIQLKNSKYSKQSFRFSYQRYYNERIDQSEITIYGNSIFNSHWVILIEFFKNNLTQVSHKTTIQDEPLLTQFEYLQPPLLFFPFFFDKSKITIQISTILVSLSSITHPIQTRQQKVSTSI